MLKQKGGNPARDGFYWKKGEWEIVTVEGKNGRLPGGIECEYIKVPGLLFVPAALMASVLFVIFLPFVGFGMVFVLIAMKARQGLGALSSRIVENLALNYKGGNPARDGFYWKKGEWEIVTVEGKNGRLPGGIECEYIKVPGLLFLPAALMLSVLFVIFLPFVGFGMLFALIGMKAVKGLGALSSNLAENLAQWAQAIAGNPRLGMATTVGTVALSAREARVGRGGAGGVTETREDPVTDTAEDFVTENTEHLDRADRAR